MADANPLDRVADHVVSTGYEALPPAVTARVKTFLLDTIGVGIAGSSGAGIAELKQVAAGWGNSDEARVWLTGERLPAQAAAIVNAYQTHCLEFDCVHEAAVLHPMATILSAVMAWSERARARGGKVDGKSLITALALGVDVSTMLGVVTDAPLEFFRPATAGGFGAVTAIGKIAGFDRLTLKNALGAQYSQTSGTLQPHVEGSPLLGMQVGFNARAAIVSADIAQAGFRGPHDILTGQYGYFRLFEQNRYDLEPFLARLGEDWQMLEMSHKPFPSGRLTHGTIDALRQLIARHGFSADDVAGVTCHVPPLVHRLVGRPLTDAPEANYAKLCLRFVAGVFLARGRVDVPDFMGRAALTDADVHRYARLVDVKLDANPDANAMNPQTVEVTLRDGRNLQITLPFAYGHPAAPLSPAENVDKFRRCAGYGSRPLPAPKVDALIDAVDRLETLDDVATLVDLTQADERS
ncbi:MmgE/PrpD family protein [Oceanibacterium hippocampi]|uniref:MmgE/PrpD family protein n=1 Tax=Oceanibacterium hippocampi TaxID=745714 RepID=A0A1Y5TXV9_9PROT|nr:MmgE/PrpD family protein [Oceanibacterium hippocampi]SLN75408.1 MmgE/PrpD family protein [Oceanibacterium hippocampi]